MNSEFLLVLKGFFPYASVEEILALRLISPKIRDIVDDLVALRVLGETRKKGEREIEKQYQSLLNISNRTLKE